MNYHESDFLISALRKGKEKAYLFLIDTYHRRLHAYALSLVGDKTISKDIVQNVFLKTWQFRKKLDPKSNIQSFLFKSVYNEFITNYQKNKSLLLLQHKYLESMEHLMENTSESSFDAMITDVNTEIEKLPKKCKEVFVLSKKEGLTNIEIAAYLDISIKTVEGQITKAFKILKNNLAQKYQLILIAVFGDKLQHL